MKGAMILIVNDDESETLEIQNKVISLGYDVPLIAANGEEAIMKMDEICIDLILLAMSRASE